MQDHLGVRGLVSPEPAALALCDQDVGVFFFFFWWETVKGSPSVVQYGTRHGLLLRFWEAEKAPGFHSLVGYELPKAEVRVGDHRAMSHCQIYIVAVSGFLAYLYIFWG